MNSKHRFFYGLLSSLLFAVGLTHAADRFDPLNRNVGIDKKSLVNGIVRAPAGPCQTDTWAASN
ncbi:MAG TPA: hypothetical protein VHD62_16145 [Opitutaceae bacterium]|nr:hypothetical protein [Opitutaceae bacterium]